MFGDLSHLVLQQYWWIIVSLLGALLVFLMFVQGGQTLIYTLGKTSMERTMLVNTLGRKWEFTFTTLVTFGGAFFASFPLFYSTSFGGAYWVWMLILFAFVIQAISYEFRTRPNNVFGTRTYETFLLINGLLGTILLGTAVATFFTGSAFSVNDMNQSQWELKSHGLEAALNLHNLSLGLAVFFLARVLGLLYFMNSIKHDELFGRAKKHLIYNGLPFLFFFLTFVIWLFIRDGYAVDPETQNVYLEPFKYFKNMVQMPLVLVLFVVGVAGVLFGLGAGIVRKECTKGIWAAGAGTVLTVFSLFLVAGFNNTAFYPSSFDLQSSLTIQNASSSHFTLTAMSYASLLVPFVFGYIWYVWRALNSKPIDEDEMQSDDLHIY
ncbi:cytochrome d ubiquinol oxidase subunit II [Carboxylicivirga taeanensis]|uniref:cytochrome d ubiquinol oxidase subunit II n=1 Tax=Carboxylicivirga taeanensis TaxID=1416875 RepID=UPI003F6E42E8